MTWKNSFLIVIKIVQIMSKIKIYGNPNPVIGIKEYYSIHDFFGSPAPSKFMEPLENIPDENIKWSVWILLGNEWVKMTKNNKTGATVDYTFTQTSLTRKGIRMLVDANGEKAVLDIKTKKNVESKILHVEILDSLGKKPTKLFSYGETITARVHCLNMEKFRINVTLWENDGGKKDLSDISIETKETNVLNGIADVKFTFDTSKIWLANAKTAPGESNEGAFHEYYVTAEFYKKVSKPTKDINVINPDYKVDILSKTSASKPSEKENKKPSPAEQKGPSKKETRGVAKTERKAHDYHEQKVNVKKEIWKDPFIEKINSYLTVNIGGYWGDKNKVNCVCKEYDLIWGNKVSCDFRKKVIEISKSLWPDKYKSMANGLMAVMRVETSETFSPSKIELVSYAGSNGKKKKKYAGLSKEAINKLDDNFNGAVGLIQFTKDAIDALNKENSLSLTKKKLALMRDIDQLDYVKKYFMLYNWYKKLLSPEDIYLQVFAPIGIAKEEDYVLYKKYENPQTDKERTSTKNYNANKSVDEENNNDNKIQRSEILGRYRTSYVEGMLKKEKEFSCGAIKPKEESNGTGVLDEMKALVDKHIPYSQLGVRNSLSEKGLEGLDCSETVSIYLTKLGITTSVKEINTGIMTTQKDFRKAIDSENIDFVSGSDSEDFKPNRGDIFVWRTDGIGHTGIVYKYDEKNDLVTILEAIGNVGSADETTNINNGGYSGKGSSRTAVYKRSGKALVRHKGWKGYFRPKNYKKKL